MKLSTCLLSIVALCLMPLCLSGCPEVDDTDAIIDGIEFVWCPAGSFTMGRRGPGEEGSSASEDPAHLVTFAQGFWISKYEITQKQYEAVMEAN
ncbi:MAG: SUMF1/EgtB/PvdO family nonheme iron enzyme, partial [Candidatus Hydrogenedentes bacterium]|nr:SUMF1/EgtB/PvdO family nonheme iron enzyme [Candidatus Hydrogenedentota bacterium]